MKRLAEMVQFLVAVVCQALNNTNVTGRYINVKNFPRACFHLMGGAMAATKTTIIALYEATDEDGTSAAAISGATATVTANTLVTKATVALASAGAGDLVVINGLTFTQGTTAVATRTFADAAGLVLCVNHAVYGVPGVEALASTTNVLLYPSDPGDDDDVALTITSTDVGGTVTVATNECQAFVDLDVSKLSSGFSHVAAKVTTTANGTVSVVAEGYGLRHRLASQVGASATL
ncbi:MAG: hypothetical protein KAY24_01210 [Candidatus Eisenbacteria sp.]|nr:hypothetical protein [Candidatus Eisenbacteria bacterium]